MSIDVPEEGIFTHGGWTLFSLNNVHLTRGFFNFDASEKDFDTHLNSQLRLTNCTFDNDATLVFTEVSHKCFNPELSVTS